MYDIQRLWDDLDPSEERRICVHCGYNKITKAFNGDDKTCKLCRKLITMGLKFKKVNLSAETLHQDNDFCYTCGMKIKSSEFAQYSHECKRCFDLRCLTEYNHYAPYLQIYIKCTCCLTPKFIDEFSIGRLICKRCTKSK